MTFTQSIRTCFTQKFFTVSSRASRSEFWWFVFAYILLVILMLGIIFYLPAIPHLIPLGLILAAIIPYYMVGMRRMHDIGKSGWHFFMPLFISRIVGRIEDRVNGIDTINWLTYVTLIIGLLCLGYLIYFLTRPSQTSANEYGEIPAS